MFPFEALSLDWSRLLHYRGGKSEIDSKAFFTSPKGQTKSEEELKNFTTLIKNEITTIKGSTDLFSNDAKACEFPLRYVYLIENNLVEGKESYLKGCSDFQSFIKKVGTGRVSLVFSSYFMGNPGSIFGHTLLKISKTEYLGDEEKDPLLSYGINYAASAGEERGLFYALKGLLGLYDGEFTAIPYYYKVREYNDYESRDLWIYDLNLSEKQKRNLLYHIWELGRAKAAYYFFNKNCSYHLLKSLEVVLPQSLSLSSHYNYFTIPSQTVKRVYKTPGLVDKIHYRPSLKSRLDFKISSLKKKKQRQVVKSVKKLHKGETSKYLNKMSAQQLDTAIDLYDFYYFKEYFKDNKTYLKLKRPLLIERSKRNEKPEYEYNGSPPHKIHQASFFSLSSSYSKEAYQYNLTIRPAFHSYLENPDGLMPYGEVIVGEISLGFFDNRLTKNSEFNLNSAKWLKASDHSPVSTYKIPLSWSFDLSSNRPLFNQDFIEHSALLETGLSFKLSGLNFVYATSFIKASFIDSGAQKLFHEEGLRLGLRLKIVKSLFVLSFVEAFLRNSVQEDFEWEVDYGGEFGIQKNLSKKWSFSLLHEERFEERRTKAELRRYF